MGGIGKAIGKGAGTVGGYVGKGAGYVAQAAPAFAGGAAAIGNAFGGPQNPNAGQGVQPGPPAVAPQTTPGLQPGTPLQGDYDLSGPGALETRYEETKGQFAPGAGPGGQWWTQNQGSFGSPGIAESSAASQMGRLKNGPATTDNAQQYLNKYEDKSQGLAANMGGFYDRAQERSAADIDKAFAARGMFGSSAATGAIGQSSADLNADRARAEADYGLKRAAEQRGWSGLEAGAAAGADASNLSNAGMGLSYATGEAGIAQGAQNAELARLLGAGNLAGGFDAAELNRINSGINAAGAAQGAREGRVQNMFGNVSAPGMATFGMAGQSYPQMFGTDQALQDNAVMMGTGVAQAGQDQDRYATEKQNADLKMAMDAYTMYKTGGFGGLGGGTVAA